MEQRLRRDGYGVLSLDLGLFWRYNTKSIDQQGQYLAQKMEGHFVKITNSKIFHIIGHSMGGLIARQYIQFHGGDERVKSLITLGTPHHGTPLATVGIGLMLGGLLSKSPMQMTPIPHSTKTSSNNLSSKYSSCLHIFKTGCYRILVGLCSTTSAK